MGWYCDTCGRTGGHAPGCPENESLYIYSDYQCIFCDKPIINGERYVKNESHDYAHYDCLYADEEAIEFLGGEVKTMRC